MTTQPKKMAIAVIHGMGSQTESQFNQQVQSFKSRIECQLQKSGFGKNDLVWEPIYWAKELNMRQEKYLNLAFQNHRLCWKKSRNFVTSYLGDAAAYLPVASRRGTNVTYDLIHDAIDQAILYLNDQVEEDTPLVIFAHSLGSVIISNYIWDLQRDCHLYDLSRFQALKTLVGLVTFGSTIPLFALGHDPIEAIQFPSICLDPRLKDQARWLNFYDSDDILGYPLKETGESYADMVQLEDINIRVGGLLRGWNPLVHTRYWTSRRFINSASNFLVGILEAGTVDHNAVNSSTVSPKMMLEK